MNCPGCGEKFTTDNVRANDVTDGSPNLEPAVDLFVECPCGVLLNAFVNERDFVKL
jgi:hypothetical protein